MARGVCLTCGAAVDTRAGYHDCNFKRCIAQLEAELTEARKEAAENACGRNDAMEVAERKHKKNNALLAELKAERAAHARTQAEAAAMRIEVEAAYAMTPSATTIAVKLSKALDTKAGRALAARVRRLEAVYAAVKRRPKGVAMTFALRDALAALDEKGTP